MSNTLLYKKLDQNMLDTQYNNRKRVPEVEDIYKSWVAPSEKIITEFRSRLDVPYGSSEREKLDLILPDGNGPYPVNIYIHGGYWMSRVKSDQRFLARPFVEAGAAFCAIEYDLIPNVKMKDIVSQVRKAVIWVFENAEKLNIDRTKLFISGHSAGGHLVSILMATDWAKFLNVSDNFLTGGCAISGLYELLPVKLCYIQNVLKLSDNDVSVFSSIRYSNVPSSPLIVAVGSEESEEFLDQSRDFVKQWNRKGANCSYTEIIGCNHFDILESLVGPESTLIKKIISLIGLQNN